MTDCRVERLPVRGDLCERPDSRRRRQIVTASRQQYTTVAAICCYTVYSNVTARCRRRCCICTRCLRKPTVLFRGNFVAFPDRQRTSRI